MSEKQARYALSKMGYGLHKSRVQNIHADNPDGYMISMICTEILSLQEAGMS